MDTSEVGYYPVDEFGSFLKSIKNSGRTVFQFELFFKMVEVIMLILHYVDIAFSVWLTRIKGPDTKLRNLSDVQLILWGAIKIALC